MSENDNIIKETWNNLVGDEVIKFLFVATNKTRSKKLKVSNFLLKANGLNTTVKDLKENIHFEIFLKNTSYSNIVKETDDYIILQLTSEGIQLANKLDYKKTVVTNLIVIKIFLAIIIAVAVLLILPLIPVAIIVALVVLIIVGFYNKTVREVVLYAIALLGVVYAVMEYYK